MNDEQVGLAAAIISLIASIIGLITAILNRPKGKAPHRRRRKRRR